MTDQDINSHSISFPIEFLDEISKANSISVVLQSVAHWLPHIIKADRCSIALPVDDQYLRLFAIQCDKAIAMDHLLPIEGSFDGKVYKAQKLHIVNNLGRHPEEDCQALYEGGLNSLMVAPMLNGDRCYGVMNIAYEQSNFYSEHDAMELVGVADWVASNIRIHKQVDEERKLASTDALTDIMNRRAFLMASQASLSNYKRHGQDFVFAILDIDHFKSVNDTYGHQAGDAALVAFSQKLKSMVRGGDFIARLGGEEFGITLNYMKEEHAVAWANRFREEISKLEIEHEGKKFRFTVSIGMSMPTAGDEKFDDIINRADKALYAAKDAGRNLVKLAS